MLVLMSMDGVLTIIGAVYCDFPILIYIEGCFATPVLIGELQLEFLLALDRCLWFSNHRFAKRLFPEEKDWTWLWGLLPVFTLVFCFIFTKGFYFSAFIHAGHINPHFVYFNEMTNYVRKFKSIKQIVLVLWTRTLPLHWPLRINGDNISLRLRNFREICQQN